MSCIDVPLKFAGGKGYMAKHIHAIAAPFKYHPVTCPGGWLHRVIPYAGGLGELWNWDYEDVSEVVNDVDWQLINFWKVLQHEHLFDMFKRHVEATPFSENAWKASNLVRNITNFGLENNDVGKVMRAYLFFINVRQSMAGMGKTFAPLSRNRVRRGMNEQASAWLTAVEGLPTVHERLKRVVIVGPKDALDVIREQDGPKTLTYCDPPYPHGTRVAKDIYAYEMTLEQHSNLLDLILTVKGRVMLSGYSNDLYNEKLKGWNVHAFELPNAMGKSDTKRIMTELIWTNF